MTTLEGKAWSWYKSLENGSIYSLANFHDKFYEMYKGCHPSLLLVKDCCKHSLSLIQYLEDCYDDNEFMDEEILEALHNNAFQHQEESITSHEMQHENQQGFTYENHVTSSETNVKMQQTCQYFDHKEYENDYKHQEEIQEEPFYNPQAEEKVVHFCNSLQQLTSKNHHNNEENYMVCGNHSEKQLDNISNKCCATKDQWLEVTRCYEDHQADHVFWDPIARYMEEFYSPVFQFFYEDQRQFQWQWSSQYHNCAELRCSKKTQMSDKTNDWLHWKFHID